MEQCSFDYQKTINVGSVDPFYWTSGWDMTTVCVEGSRYNYQENQFSQSHVNLSWTEVVVLWWGKDFGDRICVKFIISPLLNSDPDILTQERNITAPNSRGSLSFPRILIKVLLHFHGIAFEKFFFLEQVVNSRKLLCAVKFIGIAVANNHRSSEWSWDTPSIHHEPTLNNWYLSKDSGASTAPVANNGRVHAMTLNYHECGAVDRRLLQSRVCPLLSSSWLSWEGIMWDKAWSHESHPLHRDCAKECRV